ncbi:MAG: pyridoxamine 5'-phosphate oxidase family protein [Actinomycetota bacterium]|nr:pyridoxamine 5'-phosphate oxidase family protein [Actinomycetota bacterium]
MHHPGELSVQHRAGVDGVAHGSATVGRDVPAVAEQFLLEQRMIVISAERKDAVWTTVLVGEPGFIETLSETTFTIAAELPAEDPLFGAFDAPLEVGMIAIEPETRRRMRINGRAHMRDHGLLVHADQVFGNCPKYIQTRRGTLIDPPPVTTRATGTRLTEEQVAWVGSADTFFVGTTAPGLGADASHRGGNPGFVDVEPERLSWPDYVGNSMYMTLGNLALDPRAGLLFIDFDNGDSLHLSGRAKVDWHEARAAARPGAQRIIDMEIDHVVQLDNRVALRWELERLSKFNPPIRGGRV